MAKLHIICGNCGNDYDFRGRYRMEENELTVYISCRDCGTLHALNDKMDMGAEWYGMGKD